MYFNGNARDEGGTYNMQSATFGVLKIGKACFLCYTNIINISNMWREPK